jgi:hypothetical protein
MLYLGAIAVFIVVIVIAFAIIKNWGHFFSAYIQICFSVVFILLSNVGMVNNFIATLLLESLFIAFIVWACLVKDIR